MRCSLPHPTRWSIPSIPLIAIRWWQWWKSLNRKLFGDRLSTQIHNRFKFECIPQQSLQKPGSWTGKCQRNIIWWKMRQIRTYPHICWISFSVSLLDVWQCDASNRQPQWMTSLHCAQVCLLLSVWDYFWVQRLPWLENVWDTSHIIFSPAISSCASNIDWKDPGANCCSPWTDFTLNKQSSVIKFFNNQTTVPDNKPSWYAMWVLYWTIKQRRCDNSYVQTT